MFSTAQPALRLNPEKMAGTRLRKEFGEHGWFEGTVVGKTGQYYQIEYDDGDREDMTVEELRSFVRVPAARVPGSERRTRCLPGRPGETESEAWRRKMEETEKKKEKARKKKEKTERRRRSEAARGGVAGKGERFAGSVSRGGFREAAIDRLTQGLAESTQSKNRTMMKHFRTYLFLESMEWADLALSPDGSGIPEMSKRNETTFMGFAEYLAVVRGIAMKTTGRQYVSGVKTLLGTESGYDPTYGQRWLRLRRVLGRLEIEYPTAPKRRDGFLQQHLLQLREKLDLSKRQYKMYWALVLMLFFGVSRKGDHLPSSRRKFDETTDTTVSDVTRVSAEVTMVKIKQTKTRSRDHLHNGKPFVRDEGNPLCPVTALESYMASSPLGEAEDPTSTALFRHEDGSAVSGDDLTKFVKIAARTIGLEPDYYSGHSLRIGGATAALACKSGDEYSVKVLGMWVGEAVQLYTRPTIEMIKTLLLEMMRKKTTSATSTLG